MEPARSLEEQVATMLRRVMHLADLHSRMLLAETGLTFPQLAALQALEPSSLTIGALARRIHLTQATVTGIVDRLAERGLVVRARTDADRRTVQVELLPPGREIVARQPAPLRSTVMRKLDGMPDWEKHMILSALGRLADVLAHEPTPTAPPLAVDSG